MKKIICAIAVAVALSGCSNGMKESFRTNSWAPLNAEKCAEMGITKNHPNFFKCMNHHDKKRTNAFRTLRDFGNGAARAERRGENRWNGGVEEMNFQKKMRAEGAVLGQKHRADIRMKNLRAESLGLDIERKRLRLQQARSRTTYTDEQICNATRRNITNKRINSVSQNMRSSIETVLNGKSNKSFWNGVIKFARKSPLGSTTPQQRAAAINIAKVCRDL